MIKGIDFMMYKRYVKRLKVGLNLVNEFIKLFSLFDNNVEVILLIIFLLFVILVVNECLGFLGFF